MVRSDNRDAFRDHARERECGRRVARRPVVSVLRSFGYFDSSRVEGNAMTAVQIGDMYAATDFDYLAPPARETVRILLVDDDPVDREIIVRAARGGEQLDLVFTQCGSSGEAKASLAREHFDLAIVDYWLGEGTSIPLILEAHDKYHLPVVLLTGLDTPEVRRCGFRAGIAGYLSKDALVVQAIESAALGVLYSDGARMSRAVARV
jgi:CheY-like chemotaxis protein